MTRKAEDLSIYRPKILLLGIQAPYNKTTNIESYFEEFINLVRSNDIEYDVTHFIKLREIDSAYFISKGKLEELYDLCKEHDIDEVIVSEPLSPQQERNLSEFLHCNVFDRTQLILEIFEKSAHSAEGKTQVEIAMLQHSKSRLAGKGVHMGQQSGVAGFRGGFGETAKEKERRHIELSILNLKKQLEKIQQIRETQRKKRLGSKIPLICLIGYTNAGKSTILNLLTKSDVLAEDRLFATLDTTTRELYIEKKKIGLLSDTVGFIQLLPHNLIEAFKSTLSELDYANLLLQVIDISDSNWQYHVKVVNHVLKELNVENKAMVYVFNKADKITITPELMTQLNAYQPHVIVSSISKNGIAPLVDYLKQQFPSIETELPAELIQED